jgi:hypothetical protein
LTGVLPADALADYPPDTRIIVRRERPHPGAQLDLIEHRDGWRYTCFATDTLAGQLAWLDARHRSHARVEDRIRCGKDTGLGRFPSRQFAINQAWLACTLTAIDLIAWTQTILLHDDPALARAEPKAPALSTVARRRPTGPRRPQTPAQDRPHLALGTHPCPGLRPDPRTAHAGNLTRQPRPDQRHGQPGNRARAINHAHHRRNSHQDHNDQ